jgi:hypothetical protein
MERVWEQLTGSTELAAADVLYQLSDSRRLGDGDTSTDLVKVFEKRVRPIIENCLKNRDSLPSIFQYGGNRDPNVIRFLIGTLGSIGDAKSIPILATMPGLHP